MRSVREANGGPTARPTDPTLFPLFSRKRTPPAFLLFPRWPQPAPSPCSPCWWSRPPRLPPPRLPPSRLAPRPSRAKERSRASSAPPATSLSTPTAATSFRLGGTVSVVDGWWGREEEGGRNARPLRPPGGGKNRYARGTRKRARVPRASWPPLPPHSAPTTNPGSTRCVRKDAVGHRRVGGGRGRRAGA